MAIISSWWKDDDEDEITRWRCSIFLQVFRSLHTILQYCPEPTDVYTPGYADTATLGLLHDRPSHLPSLVVEIAVKSIRHDVDVPSFSLAIVEEGDVSHLVQENSNSDRVV